MRFAVYAALIGFATATPSLEMMDTSLVQETEDLDCPYSKMNMQ